MDTSASLLDSLRDESDEEAWRRLVTLYSPLLRNWLLRHNANMGDIDDVVQEVMTVVLRRFPEFQRQPTRYASKKCWRHKSCLSTDFMKYRGEMTMPSIGEGKTKSGLEVNRVGTFCCLMER